MKTILFTLAFFLFANLLATAQNPVPNPGFENWTGGNPNHWFIINLPGIGVPVTEVTPGRTGGKALKSEVVEVFGNPLLSPLQSHADENLNGFPVEQNYTNLRLYYQFNPMGGDDLKVAILVFDENGFPLSGDEVVISEAAANFTELNIPIVYDFPGEAARCLVSMVIEDVSLEGEDIGSYFIVDDVELNNGGATPTSEESPYLPNVRVYPNPCTATANITLTVEDGGHYSVGIFDLQGREVVRVLDEDMHGGIYELKADLHHLQGGTYIFKVASPAGISCEKLIIN
jgi:Secretion system C-terminal sorting domain